MYPNVCLLGPKWPFGGPTTDQIQIFGAKKVCMAPLSNYRGLNWCESIRTNYQKMNGTLLDRNMCLLGPKRPFGGPETDIILIFGPKKVHTVPFITTEDQIGVLLSVLK